MLLISTETRSRRREGVTTPQSPPAKSRMKGLSAEAAPSPAGRARHAESRTAHARFSAVARVRLSASVQRGDQARQNVSPGTGNLQRPEDLGWEVPQSCGCRLWPAPIQEEASRAEYKRGEESRHQDQRNACPPKRRCFGRYPPQIGVTGPRPANQPDGDKKYPDGVQTAFGTDDEKPEQDLSSIMGPFGSLHSRARTPYKA